MVLSSDDSGGAGVAVAATIWSISARSFSPRRPASCFSARKLLR